MRYYGIRHEGAEAFARLCGAHGHKVTDAEDIETTISEALALDGPALVEFMTDAELV